MNFTNPSSEQIRTLLQRVRRIAIVGLSPRPDRPSFRVAAALQQLGFTIVPVRPAVDEVLGERAYPDLRAVPGAIDLVDVFRNPDQVDPVVDDCIALGVPALWLQDGVVNESAACRARDAGIQVIMDRCLWRDAAMHEVRCG